jgi:hypothetical protein
MEQYSCSKDEFYTFFSLDKIRKLFATAVQILLVLEE